MTGRERCGRLIPHNARRCKRRPGHNGVCEGYRWRAVELDGPRPEPGTPLAPPAQPVTLGDALTEVIDAAVEVRRNARHHAQCEPLSVEGCKCGMWRLSSALDTLAALDGVPE